MAPAATRAAVSRAEARSSTSRASVKPYFCMPARSAWPGRGWVSGVAVSPGAGDISSVHFRSHSELPISMATGEPSVRPWRMPVSSCELVLLEAHPGATAEAQTAPGQLGLEVLLQDRQPGGQPLDHDDEGLAVGLTSGQVPEHPPTIRAEVSLDPGLTVDRAVDVRHGDVQHGPWSTATQGPVGQSEPLQRCRVRVGGTCRPPPGRASPAKMPGQRLPT